MTPSARPARLTSAVRLMRAGFSPTAATMTAAIPGRTLDRPALQALLGAVRERQIDVIVVYKVDRLTRSLADFAKLVELFDAHGVSFISITQSFNTTTSMGRLTLNMLLSFAQFEREVTGERIRDKIAASKKKGLWVGGVVPLGYKVVDRKLMIDEAEAVTVRLIFERYCALGSMIALMRELHEREVVTRRRTLSTGRTIGGIAFTKGPLAYLLKNRMYLGEINHGPTSYPGEHPAIVDKAIFDKAQEILARNAAARGYSQSRSQALLVGRLYDDRGHRMTPSFAVKRGVRYRYYVSRAVTEGRNDLAGSTARVPAVDVEDAVLKALRQLASTVDPKRWSRLVGPQPREANRLIQSSAIALRDGALSTASRSATTPASSYRIASAPSSSTASEDRRLIEAAVERVAIRDGSIEIALTREAAAIVGEAAVVVPWRKPPARVSRELIPPIEGAHIDGRADPVGHQGETACWRRHGSRLARRAYRRSGSRHRRYCAARKALHSFGRNAVVAGLSRSSPGPSHRRQSHAPRHRPYASCRPAERLVRAVQGARPASAAIEAPHLEQARPRSPRCARVEIDHWMIPPEHSLPDFARSLQPRVRPPCRSFAHRENLIGGQRQGTPKAAVTTRNDARDRRWAESPAVTPGYVEDFHRRPKARRNAGVAGGPGRTRTCNQTVMSGRL